MFVNVISAKEDSSIFGLYNFCSRSLRGILSIFSSILKGVGGCLLDGEKLDQVYLPPGIAHGFCVLSDSAQIFYKCTEFYLPGDEGGLLWNDPDLGIKWPIGDPHVTARDTQWPCLKDLPEDHLPRL